MTALKSKSNDPVQPPLQHLTFCGRFKVNTDDGYIIVIISFTCIRGTPER
jgi:hypothetical protein